MWNRIIKKEREKEILHNYMEVLAQNYTKMEPNEMSSSICEIYDRLDRPSDRVINRITAFALVYSFIGIAVLVINFFRRKV